MHFNHAYITVWRGAATLVLERDHGEHIAVKKLKNKGIRFRGNTHNKEIVATECNLTLNKNQQEKITALKKEIILADYGKSIDQPGIYPLSDNRLSALRTIIEELEYGLTDSKRPNFCPGDS